MTPRVPYLFQEDGFGNLLEVGSCREEHAVFEYSVRGCGTIDLSRRCREPAHPVYGVFSPYTKPDEAMWGILSCLPLEGGPRQKASVLMKFVYDHFEYTPASTSIHTTAQQAFHFGKGVCQDYAHVLLALCRMCGIKARYVSGLTVGEGATHAWTEIYDEGIWFGFDPTHCREIDEQYLRLSVGRDFGDCPIEQGIFQGNCEQKQTVFMMMKEQ